MKPSARTSKTNYPGVIFRMVRKEDGTGLEKQFYVIFKRDGKKVEQAVGRQSDGMTPRGAAEVRADLMRGKQKLKRDQEGRVTYQDLWDHYRQNHTRKDGRPIKGWKTYESIHRQWLQADFGDKQPQDIAPLDVDRLRIRMQKAGKSNQIIKHALSQLQRVCNYGFKKRLAQNLSFPVELPSVQNVPSDTLTDEQLNRLVVACKESTHPYAPVVILLGIFTAMRRGEILPLKWSDIDFDNKWINARDAKSGRDERYVLNRQAETILKQLENRYGRDYTGFIFPSSKSASGHVVNLDKETRAIKTAAKLPASFKILHGLRHSFLTLAAENPELTVYDIQQLGTHKDIATSQKYVNPQDKRVQAASQKVADSIEQKIAIDL